MHLFQFFKISLFSCQSNLILFDNIDTLILNFRLPLKAVFDEKIIAHRIENEGVLPYKYKLFSEIHRNKREQNISKNEFLIYL
jgi:hypothetical protein